MRRKWNIGTWRRSAGCATRGKTLRTPVGGTRACGYADYMQTDAFSRGARRTLRSSRRKRVALMCAEAVPVAMPLLARRRRAFHTRRPRDRYSSETTYRSHKLTLFARVTGTQITYPPDQGGTTVSRHFLHPPVTQAMDTVEPGSKIFSSCVTTTIAVCCSAASLRSRSMTMPARLNPAPPSARRRE